MTADQAGFEALTREISRSAGLTLDAYKDKCLRRRIAVRMRACGVHTYAEYQHLLARSPGEYELLKDALTINVTRFFRNAETWERLRVEHLPPLLATIPGVIRVWSAGCASGDEAYGLVILVAEAAVAAGGTAGLDRVQVDATDIDRRSLERAADARYRTDALVEAPPELVSRYFELEPDGYRVAAPVRRRVRLRRHDLGRDHPPGTYHLIVCRNVVIYFERPTQERLFQAFADALVPGGLLVLGKVETLFGPARERLQLLDPRERIYRRPA
ncbi:MAG TPA: protein-glutamate O-methyltransferase CheR [Gemmatimonadales bacterium]|nr:protein-glutamate O-methyltransferase CheR [Gemmatimonadales bacterium]